MNTEMTGFKNFDRLDRWVLTTVTIFMMITIWFATHAPASMSATTMLLAALSSGMFASGRLIWRTLPKPSRMNFFPPAEPLRVLNSMSTMSRFKFNAIVERCRNDKQAMLAEFRAIYKADSMDAVTHFTIDRRDRAYDPIGAYKVIDGISPACEAPCHQEGMINIFWYHDQPTVRINGNTGEKCRHTNPEYCLYCRCYDVSQNDRVKVPSPTPIPAKTAPATVLPKAKHIHRGGLGSSAIHHGISKRAKMIMVVDPANPRGSAVVVSIGTRGERVFDRYDNQPRFSGFTHVPTLIPDRYVTGNTDVLSMGYNRGPQPWPEPHAVIMNRDGEMTKVTTPIAPKRTRIYS